MKTGEYWIVELVCKLYVWIKQSVHMLYFWGMEQLLGPHYNIILLIATDYSRLLSWWVNFSLFSLLMYKSWIQVMKFHDLHCTMCNWLPFQVWLLFLPIHSHWHCPWYTKSLSQSVPRVATNEVNKKQVKTHGQYLLFTTEEKVQAAKYRSHHFYIAIARGNLPWDVPNVYSPV